MRIGESKFNWQWQMVLCLKVVVNTFILNILLAFYHSENENRRQKKKVGKKFPQLSQSCLQGQMP